jgi:IclR family pca regulon transcriptional regulator
VIRGVTIGTDSKANSLSVRAAERTLAVLEAFSRHGRSMSLGAIAKETGLHKSAVQRCAATLTSLGYLEPLTDGKLHASSRCLDLGFNFLKSHPLLPHAYPVLLKLRDETDERTNLSLFERTNLIYAIRLHGRGECDLPSMLIGRRMPVYSTAGGRAMLSKLPDPEVRAILRESILRPRTSRTRTSIDEILDQIGVAKRQGFAVVRGESVTQEIALAAAVTNCEARPVAAIHMASTLGHWSADEYIRRFAPRVVAAAETLSQEFQAATAKAIR